jgi:hypothetical protein
MKKSTRSQFDLFAVSPQPIDLPPSERSKALALLQVLLMEALPQMSAPSEIDEQERSNNDKDHE